MTPCQGCRSTLALPNSPLHQLGNAWWENPERQIQLLDPPRVAGSSRGAAGACLVPQLLGEAHTWSQGNSHSACTRETRQENATKALLEVPANVPSSKHDASATSRVRDTAMAFGGSSCHGMWITREELTFPCCGKDCGEEQIVHADVVVASSTTLAGLGRLSTMLGQCKRGRCDCDDGETDNHRGNMPQGLSCLLMMSAARQYMHALW